MGLRQIRIDRHVEARRASFDAAQHQVLHGIEADCSTRDGVAYRASHLIGAEHALKVKDQPVGQMVFAAAKEGTVTTVDYDFPKPGTTQPVPKESYVTRVGNEGCGVGYYK